MVKKDLTGFASEYELYDWQLKEGEKVIMTYSTYLKELYDEDQNYFVYAYENKNVYERFCIMEIDSRCVYMDGLTKDELEYELENLLNEELSCQDI